MNARPKFSRICAWVVALALIVSLGGPFLKLTSDAAAVDTQSTNVIMNYNSWSSFSGKLAQDGDPVTVELISQSGSDKAVQMTVGTPSSGAANVGLVPDSTNWSGSIGLQMYVKNPSETAVMAYSPRFFCNNTSGQTDFWILGNGKPYSLVSGTDVTTETSAYSFVFLPAGFEGYIRMPFTSFSGGWYGTQPANINLANAGLIYATFDTNTYTGMSVIFDDVSLIKPLQKANVEDFHTWFDASGVTAESNIGAQLVNNGGHGMALKLSVNSEGTNNYAALHTTVKNWSGKGAMQLYVKNLSGEEMAFQPRFFAGNGTDTELWSLAEGTSIRLLADGIVTESIVAGGQVRLPGGFEGSVQLPFNGFTGIWYGSTADKQDLSAISGTYFFFDATAAGGNVGKSMLVDEFQLLSGLSNVTSANPNPSDDPAMVESFDQWGNLSKLSYSGDPITAELVTEVSGDNALRLTVTGAASGAVNAGTVSFTPAKQDWSGSEGLELHMENLTGGDLAVSVRFKTSNGSTTESWMPSHGTPVQRIVDGTYTEVSIVYGFVILPAGFAGQVRIPFTSYAENIGDQLSSISSISLVYDTNPAGSYIGKSMLVDDIRLVASVDEDKPTTEEIKQDIGDGLKALLDVVPNVKYLPEYDPVSTTTGTNEWDNIKALTFDGANIGTKKTKVFGYIGYPENAENAPAVVLVHGGMGHAFAQWIKLWTDRGYVAIAFDNTGYFPSAAGKGVAGRESDPTSYWEYGLSGDFVEDGYVNAPTNSGMQDVNSAAENQWMYHAVAQTILAHNILRNDPAVDADRIGITGISWGGTITSLAIGHDTRYAFAIPVYCAGYLEDSLGNMSTRFNNEVCNTLWAAEDRFDDVTFPVLWLDWNNDYSCAITSTGRSYLDTKDNNAKTTLSIVNNMNHSHGSTWVRPESYRFADWCVNNGNGLTQLKTMPSGSSFSVEFTAPADATSVSAKLYYITEELTYSVKSGSSLTPDQTWQTVDCTVSGNTVTGQVPAEAHSYYLELSTQTPSGTYITSSVLTQNPDHEGSDETTKPLYDFTMVETFNGWTDLSKIVYSGDPITGALVNESEGDNALKLTVTGTTTGATNAGTVGFTPTNRNWTGKEGLQLYMENPSDAQMAVSIRFISSNGTNPEMWMAAHGAPVKLISGETVTDSTITYSFVFLPANFQGFVRIPFSAFSGSWYGSANSSLDLSAVNAMYFTFDTNPAGAYIGKTMLVDSVSLVDTMEDLIPTGPETAPAAPEPEPPVYETKPLEEFAMVETFNKWTDLSKMAYSGDPITGELIPEVPGDNALDLTVTGASSGATNSGVAGFTPENLDWSGKEGLQIYMENPNDAQMAVSVRFIASNGTDMEMWMAAHDSPIKLVSGETVTDSTTPYGFVFLPANFQGFVRIPFTAFSGAWYGSANSSLDLSKTTSIYFAFDTTPGGQYIGKKLHLDSISLVDTMEDPIPTGTEPLGPLPEEVETQSLTKFEAVETFNTWGDLSPVVYSGDKLKVKLFSQSSGDKALKITVKGGTEKTGTMGFTPGNTKWAGKKGLQIYMENPSDEQLAVSVRFIASNGSDMELWMPKDGTAIKLISGTTVTDSTTPYSFVFLPANFKGYIRIPFSGFTGAWYGSRTGKMQLDTVTSIYFAFDTNPKGKYIGKTLVLDTISLIKSMDEPVPGDNKEPKVPNTAGGVEYKEVDASKFGTASSNTFTKIESFNAWGDLSRMVYSGDPVEGQLTELGEMGKALQINITGAKSDPLNSATTGFTPENLDWSSGGGLQIYMVNKSNKQLPVSIRFIASNGKDMDIWLADHGTPVRLITKDNKVYDTTSFYSFVFLPANFEGYVRVPFSAFSGAWYGSKNASLDLTQTTSIYFSFDTNPKNPYLGLSLVIDEIRLCKSLDDPLPFYEKEPEAPKKTESIKAEVAPTEPTSPKPIPPAFPERDEPVKTGSAPIGWVVLAIAVALMAMVIILLIVKRRKDQQQ